MVYPRNKNDKIWTAFRLKMEGINKNLRRLMILEENNNILPPKQLKEWHKG